MKTDEDSGEADEPPEEPPCRKTETGVSDENEELAWAQKHVNQEWSGPGVVFRKTGLHDRPPGSGGFRPAASIRKRRDRISEKINTRLDATDNRPDDIGDRIDRAVGRLSLRIQALETREVS